MSAVFEIHLVSGGGFSLDGGAMFGVVPRPLWERLAPPDDQHRIPLQTNCLLVRAFGRTILVDAGYGGKAPNSVREQYSLEPGEPLLTSLLAMGVTREMVDVVVLTHLHFDHAGGGTRFDSRGDIEPTFPNATYFVQRTEWEDAVAQYPELCGTYFRKDFLPLYEGGQLQLLDGDALVAPGIQVMLVGGHTRGMQIVYLEHRARGAVFLADLCPTWRHLPTPWTMAYDQCARDVRRVKPSVLQRAARERVVAVFGHDEAIPAATLRADGRGIVNLDEPVSFPLYWE
jgi:glyoxylase-like metal-dependent hydrolase (beta-lactamase superfamily II)